MKRAISHRLIIVLDRSKRSHSRIGLANGHVRIVGLSGVWRKAVTLCAGEANWGNFSSIDTTAPNWEKEQTTAKLLDDSHSYSTQNKDGR